VCLQRKSEEAEDGESKKSKQEEGAGDAPKTNGHADVRHTPRGGHREI